jgi:ribosomal protein L10
VTPERAKQLIANPPKNSFGRPYPPSKVFKHEVYSEILANPSVFLVQKMNMRIPDWVKFREACEKHEFRANVVQGKIFRALLRDVAKEQPQILELEPFLMGSIATVSAASDPERVGETLIKLLKILNTEKKAILLGGKVENAVYSTDEILRISKLPPLADMRGELVAILEQPTRRLLELLGRQQGQVVSLLSQHRDTTGYQLGKLLEAQEDRLKENGPEA